MADFIPFSCNTHLPKITEWRNDKTVTAHLACGTMTPKAVEEWISNLTPEKGNYPYAIELDQDLGGYAVIGPIDETNRSCDVGLVLGEKSCWGRFLSTST